MQIKIYHTFHSEHIFLYERILHLLQPVKGSYPELNKWYRQTFLPGLGKKERAYIVVHDHTKLVGCALLKKTPAEKKISSLFVDQDYRNKGVGERLVSAALKDLGAGVSLSVSEKNLPILQPLLQKFEFKQTACKAGLYLPTEKEYFFKSLRAHSIFRKDRQNG